MNLESIFNQDLTCLVTNDVTATEISQITFFLLLRINTVECEGRTPGGTWLKIWNSRKQLLCVENYKQVLNVTSDAHS